MILNNIAFVASITSRSQAYLEAMIKADLFPAKCILFAENEDIVKNQTGEKNKFFDLSIPLIKTVKKYSIPFELVLNKDINSDEMIVAIRDVKQEYILYSGYGGYILKSDLFKLKKKYIHIHAGILPRYRGSTTVYYSMLQENMIGATVLFLNEKIDEGDIIFQEQQPIPTEKMDIDYVYEPWVRSQALVKALKSYEAKGYFEVIKQNESVAEIYYIIHPVLKHFAMLKALQNQGQKI